MSVIAAVRRYRLLSIHITPYHFNPGILSTVVTVAFLFTMMSLGFWQLDRAEFKDTLQQKITERKNLSVSEIDELAQSADDRRYLPLRLTGEFDFQHSLLLDNKIFNGRVGYHVFTPMLIDDFKADNLKAESEKADDFKTTNPKTANPRAILISRGFIEMGVTRAELPEIKTPQGKLSLQGILDLQPSRALVLAENANQTDDWPAVLQYVDLTEISAMVGYELYDMVLWLNKDEAGSYEYDLPVLNLNSAKNKGYAFQWFAMSLALFIIYIVVNSKKESGR